MTPLRRRSGSPVLPSVALMLDHVIAIGSPFDLGGGQGPQGAQRTGWALRQRTWAADFFADDARVEVS